MPIQDPGLNWSQYGVSPANKGVNTSLFRANAAVTDTLTPNDSFGLVAERSATPVAVTALVMADGTSISVMQQGTGQVTIVAGSGVTLISDKSTASFVSARQGAVLSLVWQNTGTGTANVYVLGNTQ